MSMGIGKIMVEPLSAAMMFKVCRYLSCIAVGEELMLSAASFSARAALTSPVAVITCVCVCGFVKHEGKYAPIAGNRCLQKIEGSTFQVDRHKFNTHARTYAHTLTLALASLAASASAAIDLCNS